MPQESKSRVVAVRLPTEVYEEWARRAEAKGMSVGTYLRLKLIEPVLGRKA